MSSANRKMSELLLSKSFMNMVKGRGPITWGEFIIVYTDTMSSVSQKCCNPVQFVSFYSVGLQLL